MLLFSFFIFHRYFNLGLITLSAHGKGLNVKVDRREDVEGTTRPPSRRALSATERYHGDRGRVERSCVRCKYVLRYTRLTLPEFSARAIATAIFPVQFRGRLIPRCQRASLRIGTRAIGFIDFSTTSRRRLCEELKNWSVFARPSPRDLSAASPRRKRAAGEGDGAHGSMLSYL